MGRPARRACAARVLPALTLGLTITLSRPLPLSLPLSLSLFLPLHLPLSIPPELLRMLLPTEITGSPGVRPTTVFVSDIGSRLNKHRF